MEITFENSAGEEITVKLPTKKEVCSNCEGTGTQLCSGMRGEVYTAEEFAESFDEEQQEEYFRPGGRYDVLCEVCKGKNVVDEVDEDKCKGNPELVEALAALDKQEQDECAHRAECEAERRAGC